jgi:hypothetical protein
MTVARAAIMRAKRMSALSDNAACDRSIRTTNRADSSFAGGLARAGVFFNRIPTEGAISQRARCVALDAADKGALCLGQKYTTGSQRQPQLHGMESTYGPHSEATPGVRCSGVGGWP